MYLLILDATLSLEGSASGKALLICLPPEIQEFFKEIACQTDMQKIMEAVARYGMKIVQQ